MSSYREINVLDETKPILLVQDTDTRKMYVRVRLYKDNIEVLKESSR